MHTCENRDHGATFKVVGLTSYSKWGAETPFSQLLFIIFKKVRGAEAPGPPPSRAMETQQCGSLYTAISKKAVIVSSNVET